MTRCGLLLALAASLAAQTFEVASVRPAAGNVYRSGPLAVTDPLIRLPGYTIFGLILDAYHVRDFQVRIADAIPKEEVFDRQYDIVARAPGAGAPALDDVRAMLRNLLADRFHLQVHREPKEMQVLALVAGRGGAKLKPAAADAQCSIRTRLAADRRNNEDVFSGCPIERLADRLGSLMGNRVVLDRTGLDGPYNFRLVAIPNYRARAGAEPADIDPLTAVVELGLRLVSQKAPVEVIVVDRVERPTEN
jgi:uncharacterized protein (TIGR03435 family)